jgi:predicted HTH domain antitoxin
MDGMISVEVPQEWFEGLKAEQEAVIQEVVRLGIYEFKLRRALEMYQAGGGSLGYVASQVGLNKSDLVIEARSRGIEPPFDEQTVREELGV